MAHTSDEVYLKSLAIHWGQQAFERSEAAIAKALKVLSDDPWFGTDRPSAQAERDFIAVQKHLYQAGQALYRARKTLQKDAKTYGI